MAQRVCQFETERHMSFFQPTSSKTTNVLPAAYFELKGRWASVNLVPAIMGVVLAIGVSRIGGEAIVQDLHSGATGVFAVLASLIAFAALNAKFARRSTEAYATTGIYSISRNPAYVAFFLPLTALAYFDAMTAASCAVVYVLAMNLLVIQHQEQKLQNANGAGYEAYRAATPRWFA
jgi:protein-S-isoprenylcysteine O-methyltransferase Ste14